MSQVGGSRLYIVIFPCGVALGILSILVPIYLVKELGGTLVDLGIMESLGTALLIPASAYLGGLPDRYRKAKPFILLSLFGMSVASFFLSLASSVLAFQVSYILLQLLGYLRGPSMGILIAESTERGCRSSVLARRNLSESLGNVAGLAICSLTIGLLEMRGLIRISSLFLLISFFISLISIRDPPIYIERFLDRYERWIDRVEAFSLNLTGEGKLSRSFEMMWRREPDMRLFGIGRALFAFAASNAFTSLPIFLLSKAGLQPSIISTVFLVRNLFMSLSYLMAVGLVGDGGEKAIKIASLVRTAMIGLLPLTASLTYPYSAIATALILSIIAFSWSIYAVGVETLTLSFANPGSLGIYDALSMVGDALGGLSGGVLPGVLGFEAAFLISSCLFLLSLLTFSIGFKRGLR